MADRNNRPRAGSNTVTQRLPGGSHLSNNAEHLGGVDKTDTLQPDGSHGSDSKPIDGSYRNNSGVTSAGDSGRYRSTEKPGDTDNSEPGRRGGTTRRRRTTTTTEPADDVDDKSNTDQDGGRRGGRNRNKEESSTFTCKPKTDQYLLYVQENLEKIKKDCNEFHKCTNALFNSENILNIVAGDGIDLSNICGLLFPNSGGQFQVLNGECSRQERESIRDRIGNQLKDTLADPKEDKRIWKQIDKCLTDAAKPASEPAINTTCRLKRNPESHLCDNVTLEQKTEEFFNNEIQQLHCTCNSLISSTKEESSNLALPLRIGISSGIVGIFLLLIFVIIILCVRHRKVKRRLEKQRIQFITNPDYEPSLVYQEINYQQTSVKSPQFQQDQGGYNFLGKPPALPARYVKEPTQTRADLTKIPEEEVPEYLEPLSNGSQNSAPVSPASSGHGHNSKAGKRVQSAYYLAKHPDDPVSTPAHKLPEEKIYLELEKTGLHDDGGYLTLGQKAKNRSGEGAISQGEREQLVKDDEGRNYFLLEPEVEVAEKTPLASVSQV